MRDDFDFNEVRSWFAAEKSGQLVEVRVIGPKTGSGYFRDPEKLCSEISRFPGYGIYYTINHISDSLYGRKQHEQIIIDSRLATTSDKDVLGRDVLLIDLDSKRPAQVNATEEEVAQSKEVANKIYSYLRESGWSEPIIALSGNGVHLKYRISLANSESNSKLVKSCLEVLSMMFSTESVEVDCSVFNASRIAKIPGTRSAKGADTEERPQRMCRHVRIPDVWKVTEKEYLEKLASLLPEPDEPTRFNNFGSVKFDIDEFVEKHGIKVARDVRTSAHRRLVLEECPFCSDHKAPDSAIFVMPNGAVGFRCLHASHSHLTFKDLRLKFEPDAYSKADYYAHRQKMDYYAPVRRPFQPKEENAADGPKWLKPSDIKYVSQAEAPSIPTGYPALDKAMGRLLLGDITILSGRAAQGKSVLLNCVLLNMAARNVKIGVWSGEFQASRWFSWIATTAAGKGFVKKVEGTDGLYYAPKPYADKIAKWLDGKVWLYSCEKYSNNWAQLSVDIKGAIKLKGLQCIILDNMSALDLAEIDAYSTFDKQKSLVTEIKNIAKEFNVHVILVVHPRKTVQFLRREDIMGDSSIVNLADNCWICHRTNKDFQTRAAEFFRKSEVEEMAQFDTVVELCKCRNTGKEDFLAGLYYEPETKRLKNDRAESVVYPWSDPMPAQELPPDPDPYVRDDSNLLPEDECPF